MFVADKDRLDIAVLIEISDEVERVSGKPKNSVDTLCLESFDHHLPGSKSCHYSTLRIVLIWPSCCWAGWLPWIDRADR
jgi:hypothetical protein